MSEVPLRPPEARNAAILNVGLLDLYQSWAGLVTLLKDIREQRDLPS